MKAIVDLVGPNDKAATAALQLVADYSAAEGVLVDAVPKMAKGLLKAGFLPAHFDKVTPSAKENRKVIQAAVERGYFRDESRGAQYRAYLLPIESRREATAPKQFKLHEAASDRIQQTVRRTIAALNMAYEQHRYDTATAQDKAAMDVIKGLETLEKKEAAKPLPRLKKALQSFVESVDGEEGYDLEQGLLGYVLQLCKVIAVAEEAAKAASKKEPKSKKAALVLMPEDFEEAEEFEGGDL